MEEKGKKAKEAMNEDEEFRLAQIESRLERLERRQKASSAALRSIEEYKSRLVEMVKERRGGKMDAFMEAQVEITARAWRRLDKMDEDMEAQPLVVKETGSMGQQRAVLNPLLPLYDKLHRTVRQHFQALGLNYDAMPSKVSEASAEKEGDALANFMEGMSDDGR